MKFNDIPIKVVKINNVDLDDSTKLNFINTQDNSKIGYIIFNKTNYIDSYMEEYEGIEICNIVEEYEPMSLEYIEVYDRYKNNGFGGFMMQYFVDNYMKQNVCILLRCAFGISDESMKNFMTNHLLIKFYEKYGFVEIPNTQYMVANLY